MSANHILIVHYMTPQHYIWLFFYLYLMIVGWKMPYQTFNNFLSFATCMLQLRTFNNIMFNITTKSIIYEIINLRISFSGCIIINYKSHRMS
jgi:hypothetical protein